MNISGSNRITFAFVWQYFQIAFFIRRPAGGRLNADFEEAIGRKPLCRARSAYLGFRAECFFGLKPNRSDCVVECVQGVW